MSRRTTGRSRVALRDVAAAAGVSVSTVSRVLGSHPDVSLETRERVTAAVDELGYRPNLLGQMLRQGKTQTIGFSIADITNPLLARIALGASETLDAAGYSMILANSMHGAEQQRVALGDLVARSVDGVIVSLIDERDVATLELLRSFEGPIVAIDRDLSSVPHADAVWSDHRAGIDDAVTALHAAGHRRIALLNGIPSVRPGRERSLAFAASGARLSIDAIEVVVELDGSDIAETVRTLMLAEGRPSALICGNNVLLAVLLETLRDLGLSVPDDVSLITCDEVPLQRAISPALATLKRDELEIGRTAATLLLDRLADGDGDAGVIRTLDVRYQAGASIAAPLA